MASKSDLLVCCNILKGVERTLGKGTRVQLNKDQLLSISEYLVKALKYIDSSFTIFGGQVIVFGRASEEIYSLATDNTVSAIDSSTKEYLVDKLTPTILEFKINVGKFLTHEHFVYQEPMDPLIKDIIELCLANGYYFGY